MVLVMLFMPRGIIGLYETLRQRFTRRAPEAERRPA
jgi:hypothetical protein